MRTIYKYPLKYSTQLIQSVVMPIGARVIHCAMQGTSPTMWAEIGLDALKEGQEVRKFLLYPTGGIINADKSIHIGTVLDRDFVWHIYEVTGDGSTRKN